MTQVCDTLEVKGDLFCEELAKILKELNYKKGQGADSVVNKCFKYRGCEVRCKQELRAHMALVTRREKLRAKRSYGMSSNKIL